MRKVCDVESLRASIDSYLGVMSHYASYNLRRKVFGSQGFLFRYGYFSNGLLTFKVRKHYSDFMVNLRQFMFTKEKE